MSCIWQILARWYPEIFLSVCREKNLDCLRRVDARQALPEKSLIFFFLMLMFYRGSSLVKHFTSVERSGYGLLSSNLLKGSSLNHANWLIWINPLLWPDFIFKQIVIQTKRLFFPQVCLHYMFEDHEDIEQLVSVKALSKWRTKLIKPIILFRLQIVKSQVLLIILMITLPYLQQQSRFIYLFIFIQ